MLVRACTLFLVVLAPPVILLDKWSDIREFSFAITQQFFCECTVVMFPVDSPFSLYLTELARRIAHEGSKAPQVTAYSFRAVHERGNLFSCSNPLHIVVVEESTQKDLQTLSENYQFRNSMWLVIMEANKSADFFANIRLTLGANLFSVTREEESLVITEHFRVAAGYPVREKVVGSWNRKNGLSITVDPPYKRHSDMEGLLWRVGTIENWPISSFVRGEAGKTVPLDGFFARIWLEFERILNFTSVFLPSVDGSSGRHQENGTWNGLCGMLVRQEIDVIVSEFSLSTERLVILEGLMPLLQAGLNVYYQPKGVSWNWDAILKPFDRYVWSAIAVWLSISTITLIFMTWVASKCGLVEKTNLPGNNGFFVLQTLCQQGASESPNFWGGRIFFITCYLASAVLFPCYSASLISSLTHRHPIKPFNSLKDLLYAQYPIILLDNMVEYEYFERSTDPTAKAIFKTLVRSVEFDTEGVGYLKGYAKMCKENMAFFAADSSVEILLADSVPGCVPVKFSQPLTKINQVMALPKNSPYHEVLNCNILRLLEYGIINKLHLEMVTVFTKTQAIPARPVVFSDVIEIFIFLILAMVFSVAILVVEVIVYSKSLK